MTSPESNIADPAIDAALEKLARGTADIISRDELHAKLQKAHREGRPLRVKLGLDPTAPDIHLGFAVVLRKLRAFQDLGHEAHLIIGDFTAQIGDPTGKSKTRPRLTRAEVEANAQTYQEQLFRILDAERTVTHFNGDWLGKMTFVEVIELASKCTVAQILEREDFAQRMSENKPLALHEIMYPLCQGQDSVAINADVEMGGTDQRFNNLMGRELQRINGQEPQVVLLMPLLVGTDGVQKMSKSLGNYIGIHEPPAEMFGKVMSIPDEAMRDYFVLCTELPVEEIEALLAGHPMEAKKNLGRAIVTEYWSAEAAIEAQASFEQQFSRRETPDEMPEVAVPPDASTLIDLLRVCFDISGGEARRLVAQDAVSIDGERANDATATVTPRDGMVIKLGKRRWARVRVIS
ncbi:MAG TPA: tyrosine--tRNA ligase [Abditibacteriaceae bacterium]|nr:tyrosine--tRNA ligase [Abditibacteriaceae bacterium]